MTQNKMFKKEVGDSRYRDKLETQDQVCTYLSVSWLVLILLSNQNQNRCRYFSRCHSTHTRSVCGCYGWYHTHSVTRMTLVSRPQYPQADDLQIGLRMKITVQI